MAEQDLDRQLPATPHKLQKAREKGQVARSADVVSAVVYTVAVVYLTWKGWDGLRALFALDQQVLARAAQVQATQASLWALVSGMVEAAMLLLAPFFGALVLAALLANLLQTGPVLAVEQVKPDFERINPVAGFKRVFSLRTLFETLRSVLKLTLLSVVVVLALRDLAPQFLHLAALPTGGYLRVLLDDVSATGLKLALALGLIALLDLGYTQREFAKRMRMSHREMTDEHKHREGDPRIKARIRELRRELLKRTQALRRTPDADVLITNPTHVAVALRYAHGEMDAPQVLAKGAGSMAALMRQLAARHGVPIVQNPPLARALYHELAVDQAVPPAHFTAVARIMVWVFAMRRAQALGAAT